MKPAGVGLFRVIVVMVGVHAAGVAEATQYRNVAIVALGGAAGGGDYAGVKEAIVDLPTWCGSPSAAAPCLVKVMPGRYTLGPTDVIYVSPYVHVEGAGQDATFLVGVGSGAVVYLPAGTELRQLSVERNITSYPSSGAIALTGGIVRDTTVRVSGPNAGAVGASGGRLERVKAVVTSTTEGAAVGVSGGEVTIVDCDLSVLSAARGVGVANYVPAATSTILRSRVSATSSGNPSQAMGVWNIAGTMTVVGSQITATAGTNLSGQAWAAYNEYSRSLLRGGTLRVDGSQLGGSHNGVFTDPGTLTLVGSSRVDRPPAGGGAAQCVHCYNADYQAANSSCGW